MLLPIANPPVAPAQTAHPVIELAVTVASAVLVSGDLGL